MMSYILVVYVPRLIPKINILLVILILNSFFLHISIISINMMLVVGNILEQVLCNQNYKIKKAIYIFHFNV